MVKEDWSPPGMTDISPKIVKLLFSLDIKRRLTPYPDMTNQYLKI